MHENAEEKLFIIGMWWRIAYGLLRIVFGLAVLKVVGRPLIDVLTTLMGRELIEDPNDILYTFAIRILNEHPLYITYFLAVYFIFWGIVDITLSYNLLKHKLWAFPASIAVIGVFILYELIRFSHTHSLILLWIIFLDSIILFLVQQEYKKLKPPQPHEQETADQ